VDIRLPKLFGDAAVAQYRSWEREHRPGRQRLAIYATTGDSTAAMVQHLETCGFDGTLSKPVYPSAYARVIKQERQRPSPWERQLPSSCASSTDTSVQSGSPESSFLLPAHPSTSAETEPPSTSSSFCKTAGSSSVCGGSHGGSSDAQPRSVLSSYSSPAASHAMVDTMGGRAVGGGVAPGGSSAAGSGVAAHGSADAARSNSSSVAPRRLPSEVIVAEEMVRVHGFPAELAVKLLEDFASYLTKQVAQMRSVAAAGNADSLRAIANAAHSVKSGAAQVSAKRLHIACVELEAAAQAGASERAYAALEVWYAACDELLSTLSDVSSYEKLFEAAVLTTQQQQPAADEDVLAATSANASSTAASLLIGQTSEARPVAPGRGPPMEQCDEEVLLAVLQAKEAVRAACERQLLSLDQIASKVSQGK